MSEPVHLMSNTSTCPLSDPTHSITYCHSYSSVAAIDMYKKKLCTNMLGIVDIAVCMTKYDVEKS